MTEIIDDSVDAMLARPPRKGMYVVIEGNEGSGKTTQCKAIKSWLIQTLRVQAVTVREPGGDPFGEALRQVLKNPEYVREADEELDVFTAARKGMRRRVVQPALDGGKWVIADRSELSTFVYQAFAGGLDPMTVAASQAKVGDICKPDLFIILDIPYELSQLRLTERGETKDYFESRGDIYLRTVSDGYRAVGPFARELGYNVANIDGTQKQAFVTETIKDLIVERFFRPID
ncbi:MAG: dTMP kinase [bacterium]